MRNFQEQREVIINMIDKNIKYNDKDFLNQLKGLGLSQKEIENILGETKRKKFDDGGDGGGDGGGGGDGDGGGDGGCNGGGDRWEMSRRVNIATFKCSLFAVSLAAVSTPHACHASNNWKLIMRATARWSAERTRSLCHEDELHCNHARLMPMCIKQNR